MLTDADVCSEAKEAVDLVVAELCDTLHGMYLLKKDDDAARKVCSCMME
jgi:hypothetical protein